MKKKKTYAAVIDIHIHKYTMHAFMALPYFHFPLQRSRKSEEKKKTLTTNLP